MSKRLLLPSILLVLGLCFLAAGGVQIWLSGPGSTVHKPAPASPVEVLKTVPLYSHAQQIEKSYSPKADYAFAVDVATVSFLTEDDPKQILRYYDSWFPNAGWQTWGTYLGESSPLWFDKGVLKTTGYALTAFGDGILGLPGVARRTDYVGDYRVEVFASRKTCWVAGDRVDNIEGITTVNMTLWRLK